MSFRCTSGYNEVGWGAGAGEGMTTARGLAEVRGDDGGGRGEGLGGICVDVDILSTAIFCGCRYFCCWRYFVDVDICQCRYFVNVDNLSTSIFCRQKYFVAVDILSTAIFC